MVGSYGYLHCLLLGLCLLTGAVSAIAGSDIRDFSSQESRDRYNLLVNELRCPKCQNQNLADSNSPIAMDLRDEVYSMVEAGKTDEQIKAFLVARYGDFVLYRPQVKESTLLLWLLPAILLVGALVVVFWVRRQYAGAVSDTVVNQPKLDSEQQQRLDALLNNTALNSTAEPDTTHDQPDMSAQQSNSSGQQP